MAPIVGQIRILKPAADLIFAYETRLLNILGETVPPVVRCRYCGSEITSSASFCDHCGEVNTRTICKCGNELNESDVFCDRCGLRVTVT